MKSLLNQLIFSQSGRSVQSFISTLGAVLGGVGLFLSVSLFFDLNQLKQTDEELFGENAVIIQKKVTKLSSIGLNSTDFTFDDIEFIREKPYIETVAPFESANYKVGISEYPGDGIPSFYADMFLQAVPSQFIDVDADWEWNETSEFVPLILPRDFLMLVNYGVVQSQGMPQISEDVLKMARLKIHMSGQGKRGEVTAKVVGFSHSISSILVPQSFIQQSNQLYASGLKVAPNRLFLQIKEGGFGDLESLMDEMNLDINQSALEMTKIKSILGVVIFIFILATFFIVILSVFNFIQYQQILMGQSAQKLIGLSRLGYSNKQIQSVFLRRTYITFTYLVLTALFFAIIIKMWVLNPVLSQNGIHSSLKIYLIIFILALFLWVLYSVLSRLVLSRSLLKIYKNQ